MFLDLLRKRRSVREFQDKPVEAEKVELLMEAMLRSPSSRGLNPWEFVVVRDRETIEALSKSKTHGSAFMKNAALVIVICADPQKSDVWVEDCSIASILLHLAATDLGLGSCWVQVRLREHDSRQNAEAYVAETVGLKAGLVVESMVAIGYPSKEKGGHPVESLLRERVSFDRYGAKG